MKKKNLSAEEENSLPLHNSFCGSDGRGGAIGSWL